jgi:hypothetical protein
VVHVVASQERLDWSDIGNGLWFGHPENVGRFTAARVVLPSVRVLQREALCARCNVSAHRRPERGSCYKAAMSTPIITARRNLAQRISKLLLKGGEIDLTPWQLRQVQRALEQLEEERFAEGERTMSEAERLDLYEPDGYVAKELIERQRLVDQLTAVVAAT